MGTKVSYSEDSTIVLCVPRYRAQGVQLLYYEYRVIVFRGYSYSAICTNVSNQEGSSIVLCTKVSYSGTHSYRTLETKVSHLRDKGIVIKVKVSSSSGEFSYCIQREKYRIYGDLGTVFSGQSRCTQRVLLLYSYRTHEGDVTVLREASSAFVLRREKQTNYRTLGKKKISYQRRFGLLHSEANTDPTF